MSLWESLRCRGMNTHNLMQSLESMVSLSLSPPCANSPSHSMCVWGKERGAGGSRRIWEGYWWESTESKDGKEGSAVG